MNRNTEKQEKQELMFSLVEKLNRKELSRKEILDQYNISRDSFQYWINKYRRLKEEESTNSFVCLNVKGEAKQEDIIIHYPNGVSISLANEANISLVKSLINLI